jgi:predicted AAA+ superfamily ATPase
MLERKIQLSIEEYFKAASNKVLVIEGARQIGKSYIIRFVCSQLFSNYIEINLLEDFLGEKLFIHHMLSHFYLHSRHLKRNFI